MILGFLGICFCCSVMHYLMVTRSNMYLYREIPNYRMDKKDLTGQMKQGVGTVEGLVSATSYDKFFLTLQDGKMQAFLNGELESPKVGERVKVTYVGGKPPKALVLEKPSSRGTVK